VELVRGEEDVLAGERNTRKEFQRDPPPSPNNFLAIPNHKEYEKIEDSTKFSRVLNCEISSHCFFSESVDRDYKY
jgi:hypothetical protein